MRPATVNGQDVYVVEKALVDQSQCLDLAQISADLQRIEELEAALAQYQSVSDNMADNIQSYRDINAQLSQTLDRSINLTTRYDQQIAEYDRLSGEFDQLANRYDALTEKYREAAMGRSSFISLDAGVGVDEENEVMGLIGVGIKNVKVWGFFQNDNKGLIVGGTLPF